MLQPNAVHLRCQVPMFTDIVLIPIPAWVIADCSSCQIFPGSNQQKMGIGYPAVDIIQPFFQFSKQLIVGSYGVLAGPFFDQIEDEHKNTSSGYEVLVGDLEHFLSCEIKVEQVTCTFNFFVRKTVKLQFPSLKEPANFS